MKYILLLSMLIFMAAVQAHAIEFIGDHVELTPLRITAMMAVILTVFCVWLKASFVIIQPRKNYRDHELHTRPARTTNPYLK